MLDSIRIKRLGLSTYSAEGQYEGRSRRLESSDEASRKES
jgi:hypothetical protein